MTTQTHASPSAPDLAAPEQRVQIGESFNGNGINAAHVNTVLGHLSGPAGTAWATALANPSAGHVPFVTVLRPSLPGKPLTLFVTMQAPRIVTQADHPLPKLEVETIY
ncbi:formaldehyde-activating enzyme [Arthrobacter globiformis]|uniref:formaldehyde-activating enzyme n=1 Tax=Arthrobacter globiformis TaxID=1665 RepID=UPI002782167C|nr:formaldehyde-activating enzyme [Arthrobacter globiformis]MDQ1058594.1 formaldehyde-activating enzyme [Arthrobacter globiformis]